MNTNNITKDFLTIYWDSIVGDVPGQTFYVWGSELDFPLSFWKKGTVVKKNKLFGDDWVVWVWDLKVSSFPKDWRKAMRETLLYFSEEAGLSWCSLEGYFEDPPSLFNPEMSEGYYAYAIKDDFVCHTDLDCTYTSLSKQDLMRLKGLI
ncbi:hypothetical protein [Xylocopilactobacillus apis]|uniref:Uncharacterized protein n=1 Tax=Xylocopilactobacillus apis TaxID=2932183 RepID=A0AAU9D4M4_9LACO|nr:hypothetical protein [Xylocopilactobacillus apis]BDR55772.1 hypothetical protein KIMC2_03340 [Xylocopilactobacillus apis]